MIDSNKLIDTPKKKYRKIALYKNDNSVVFDFPYKLDIINDIKEIPGRKYDPVTHLWEAKITIDTFKDIRGVIMRNDFEFESKVAELIRQFDREYKAREKLFEENIQNSERISPATLNNEDISGLKLPLKQFQLSGVEYIIANKKLIVGDEMGLGKTVQSLASMIYLNSFPCLIICPNSLKYNWKNECEKWLIDKSYKLFLTDEPCTEELLTSHNISIMSYNTLMKYQKIVNTIKWEALIVDESQSIKNKKAERSKAIKKIAKKIPVKLLLTGTAIINKPMEIIHQLNVLDKFDLFGGWDFFIKRYCDAYSTPYGVNISGATNLKELNTKLRKYCYLRRNKKEVLPELPDKQRINIELDISNRREYNKAQKNIVKYLVANVYKNIPDNFQTIYEKKKYLAEQKNKLISKTLQAEFLVQINALRLLAATGKIESITEWIAEFQENNPDEKLVLFGIHSDFLKYLANKFKCNLIIGETKPNIRQQYIDDFQNNPKSKLLILNIAIGNAGFNLTAANTVAFAELDWSPGVHLQSEDRCHRIGQKNTVTAYYLLGQNTIDVKMYNSLMSKMEIINAVNSGEINEDNNQSDNSIINDLITNLLDETKEEISN